MIDTNLLAAAFRKKDGTSAWILEIWRGGGVSVLVSEAILREYEKVLTPPLVDKSYGDAIIEEMKRKAEPVSVRQRDKVIVVADPSDDKLLICSAEGKADYLITSDQHLLSIKEFEGVKIVNPWKFREIER